MLSESHALRKLDTALRKAETLPGGVKAWCEAHKLNYSYVRDIRSGRRPMSDKVAAAIGLERVHGWRER